MHVIFFIVEYVVQHLVIGNQSLFVLMLQRILYADQQSGHACRDSEELCQGAFSINTTH